MLKEAAIVIVSVEVIDESIADLQTKAAGITVAVVKNLADILLKVLHFASDAS